MEGDHENSTKNEVPGEEYKNRNKKVTEGYG